jgi:hypothetical protein
MSDIAIYENANGDIKVDVTFEDETIWLSQSQLCEVFSKSKSTISEHIKTIFDEEELDKNSVVRKFRTTASDNKTYDVNYYNLDMIIAIGFRVKSPQGTQFRIWATKRLNEYISKGFILDDDRFKSGNSMEYFDQLQERIREIRISERFFYQKIKDIYTTSYDYNPKDNKTIEFFKIIQNKLLWAISQQTASELVYNRIDINLPQLGMKTLDTKNKNITKKDISIGKNYLNEDEMKQLGLIVEQYLAFAQSMAQQQTKMLMNDWIQRLDSIISLNGRELLNSAGKISHDLMIEKTSKIYEEYKKEKKKIQREESLKELEADIKALK